MTGGWDRARATDEPSTAIPGAAADLTTGVPASTEPSQLELRYRRLLRVLPKPYRAAREQEMVDTFLESEFRADPENADLTAKFGGVEWREAVSVLALALRLRWADPLGPERYRVRLAALRIALVAVLTMLAGCAVLVLLGLLWTALWPAGPDNSLATGTPGDILPSEPWLLANRWAYVLWIPAFALAVRGGRRATGWAAAAAAVPAMTPVISTAVYPLYFGTDWTMTVTQVVVLVGLIALSFAGMSPAIPHLRGWLIAAGGVVAATTGVELLAALDAPDRTPPTWMLPIGWAVVDNVGGWAIAVLVVGTVLAVRSLRGGHVQTASVLGLTGFGLATTLLRAATMSPWLTYGASGWPGAWATLISVTVQLALAAAITVTTGILAARRVRRMPAVRY